MNKLISDKHRDLYREYYAANDIASRPSVWLPRIESFAHVMGAYTILDYGCGTARGVSQFIDKRFHVFDYDPGVPACSDPPPPSNLVVSIHMLEHVESDSVELVIANMKSLAQMGLFLVVSCEPSTKVLPDGRPWHSFVRPSIWWQDFLTERGFMITEPIKSADKEVSAFWIKGTIINAKTP